MQLPPFASINLNALTIDLTVCLSIYLSMLRGLFHQLALASTSGSSVASATSTGLQADLDLHHHYQQQQHRRFAHHHHDFLTGTHNTLVNQSVLEHSLVTTTTTHPLQLPMELMQQIAPRQLNSVPLAVTTVAAALSAALPASHQRPIASQSLLTLAGATTSTTATVDNTTRDLFLTSNSSSKDFSCPGTVELQIKTRRRYSHESFPEKLHRLIREAVDGDKDHIVAWLPDGHGFEIHSLKAFEDEIIPTYFRHQKLASFRRQLSMYGFRRDCAKQEARRYVHEIFHRDHPERCKEVKRLTDFQLVLKHSGSAK